MSEHTKAPWVVTSSGVIRHIRVTTQGVSSEDIGRCYSDKNASIISAAPEMLTMLQQIAELHAGCPDFTDQLALSVINKALGIEE